MTKRFFAHTKLLEDNKQVIAVVRKTADLVRKNKLVINKLARLLPNCYVYASDNLISFSYNVRELDSFKDRKLTRLLEKISALTGGEFESTDYAENSNRDFKLRTDVFQVVIYSYLKDQPKGCRKVLVDVQREVVEKKIYKIECN